MAMPIDDEPCPRDLPLEWRPTAVPHTGAYALPRDILTPSIPFLDVLRDRVSTIGGPVAEVELASVLWHSMLLRERRSAGRFGIGWESRNTPSAGGLHPLRLLIIPIGNGDPIGVYEPERHAILLCSADERTVRRANEASVSELTGAKAGTTVQIVADPTRTGAGYENSESLLVRDAGALSATICLVATALGLTSCAMGRTGTEICRRAGLWEPFIGLGAVHVGSRI
ncbi:nitroreductase family protein [Gluconacetobacter aggeris]|uniref:nitroreductase family protein n=1 Tax=Gluconacetobacter aggeris TaxID=1286186 RepID=UPI0038D24D08